MVWFLCPFWQSKSLRGWTLNTRTSIICVMVFYHHYLVFFGAEYSASITKHHQTVKLESLDNCLAWITFQKNVTYLGMARNISCWVSNSFELCCEIGNIVVGGVLSFIRVFFISFRSSCAMFETLWANIWVAGQGGLFSTNSWNPRCDAFVFSFRFCFIDFIFPHPANVVIFFRFLIKHFFSLSRIFCQIML